MVLDVSIFLETVDLSFDGSITQIKLRRTGFTLIKSAENKQKTEIKTPADETALYQCKNQYVRILCTKVSDVV